VPIKGEAAVQLAGPIDGEFVVGVEGIDEMQGHAAGAAGQQDRKGTPQHAYEAAVELLGCRNPTTRARTSASSAAAAASTATSTVPMETSSNDLDMLANAAAGGYVIFSLFVRSRNGNDNDNDDSCIIFVRYCSTPGKEIEATTSKKTIPLSPIQHASWDDVVVSADATNALSKTGTFTKLKSIAYPPLSFSGLHCLQG
jgi:hypothetical protein